MMCIMAEAISENRAEYTVIGSSTQHSTLIIFKLKVANIMKCF